MWWKYLLFLLLLGFVIIVLILFINSIKICKGGEIFKEGCGRPIFPWNQRVRLSTGEYCCISCYSKELEKYAEIKATADINDITFIRDVKKGGNNHGNTKRNNPGRK